MHVLWSYSILQHDSVFEVIDRSVGETRRRAEYKLANQP